MKLRLGMKSLARFCHQMSVMLESGLTLRHALSVAERNARPELKRLYREIGTAVEQGKTLTEALEAQERRFPVLLRRLVLVGEETGQLDRVFSQACSYYELLRKIWNKLLTSLIWPCIEYWGMVIVMAAFFYIKAEFVAKDGSGPDKAVTALSLGALGFFGPILLYFVVTRLLGGRFIVHSIMMNTPVVAMVMRAGALGRFSWCMEMMSGAGVQIMNSMKWSLEATANGVFTNKAPSVIEDLKNGHTLTDSLRHTKLFPPDYLEMLAVGEESGETPQMFGRLAKNYFSRYETALQVIGKLMFWVIWAMVAAVMIYFIFTVFMSITQGYQDVLHGN